jgi:hypothetical protein
LKEIQQDISTLGAEIDEIRRIENNFRKQFKEKRQLIEKANSFQERTRLTAECLKIHGEALGMRISILEKISRQAGHLAHNFSTLEKDLSRISLLSNRKLSAETKEYFRKIFAQSAYLLRFAEGSVKKQTLAIMSSLERTLGFSQKARIPEMRAKLKKAMNLLWSLQTKVFLDIKNLQQKKSLLEQRARVVLYSAASKELENVLKNLDGIFEEGEIELFFEEEEENFWDEGESFEENEHDIDLHERYLRGKLNF